MAQDKQEKIIDKKDKFILTVIVLNSVIIFLQEYGFENNPLLSLIDVICTIIFIVEMIYKHITYGVKGYWSKGWNILDGILVLLSIPSLIFFFSPVPRFNWSIVLSIRLFRVLRLFRLVHLFERFDVVLDKLWKALINTLPIFCGFFIFIVIFALFSCALFKDAATQYFGTPLDSIYSTFRLCTADGWYDIPDALTQKLSYTQVAWARIYFIFILVVGGIIGLSLINSIFIDAIVSDNNDDVKNKIEQMNNKIEELSNKLDVYTNNQK